jgi:hypothetical protein
MSQIRSGEVMLARLVGETSGMNRKSAGEFQMLLLNHWD